MSKFSDHLLRTYAARIAGRDDSWKDSAACRGVSPPVRKLFQCAEKDRLWFAGAEVTGYAAQKVATQQYCFNCPVQWECAREGVDLHDFGVWALLTRDLRWLRQQDNPLGIIDSARIEGTPVQVAVRLDRHGPCSIPAMDIYDVCTISADPDTEALYPDHEFPLAKAKVVINGERAVVSVPGDTGRFKRVDVIEQATSKELKGGRIEVAGVSEYVLREIGTDQDTAAVSFTIEEFRLCPTC